MKILKFISVDIKVTYEKEPLQEKETNYVCLQFNIDDLFNPVAKQAADLINSHFNTNISKWDLSLKKEFDSTTSAKEIGEEENIRVIDCIFELSIPAKDLSGCSYFTPGVQFFYVTFCTPLLPNN